MPGDSAAQGNQQQEKSKYEQLKDSTFKQQTLPAYRPQPTFFSTQLTFIVFSVILFSIGAHLYSETSKIKEVVRRYDDDSNCEQVVGNGECTVKFTVEEDMEGPIFVYFELDNFYQNHRTYVKSRSNDQLRGVHIENVDDLLDCDPIVKVGDLYDYQRFNLNGDALTDLEAPAIPCGLIAKSIFTDRYSLKKIEGNTEQQVSIDETGIACASDLQYKFKNTEVDNYKEIQWYSHIDEHFIVWMRTAGLPNFRKLWGRIEANQITKADYELTITGNYDVKMFEGKKSFVITNQNAIGGKQPFLALCYILLAILCLLAALFFKVAELKKNGGGGQRP